jgi:hypothetical protein
MDPIDPFEPRFGPILKQPGRPCCGWAVTTRRIASSRLLQHTPPAGSQHDD